MPLNEHTDKIALITGASSGIGAATALLLAGKGIHVILAARRLERLQQLEESITAAGGRSTVFQVDLSQESERLRLHETLTKQGLVPDILVNNAGFAWYGYFYQMPWSISRNIIDLNIVATTHLSLLFLPYMVNRKYGRIINIGSIAGKLPEQGIAVYSASKSYIDAFSTSIHRDLKHSGVDVTIIRAGPVKTEFFETARNLQNGGSVPAERFAIPASIVADAVWRAVRHPRRVSYVPIYMFLSPLLEVFFSRIIDQVGPLLLKYNKKR